MPYKESKQFVSKPPLYDPWDGTRVPGVEKKMIEHVLTHATPNDPDSVLNTIDEFCACPNNWMMNVGDQRGEILKMVLKEKQPKLILELGCYIGYSSLMMTHLSGAKVHSLDIDKESTDIAKKIYKLAGLSDRVMVHLGTAEQMAETIKKTGPFDVIFIDHAKHLYLQDFKLLEQYGAIRKGTVIMADNVIKPGIPDYMELFKESKKYDSTLYYGYDAYGADLDGVLVSERIRE